MFLEAVSLAMCPSKAEAIRISAPMAYNFGFSTQCGGIRFVGLESVRDGDIRHSIQVLLIWQDRTRHSLMRPLHKLCRGARLPAMDLVIPRVT